MKPVEYRPATDIELLQMRALHRCRLTPASMTKRFAAQINAQSDRGVITDKQAAYLLVCCYRYRRQLDAKIVPVDPPPGYKTPTDVKREHEQFMARQAIEHAKKATPPVQPAPDLFR